MERVIVELLLNEQQALLADTATRLAADIAGPQRARALRDAGNELDRDAWRAVIDAGWLATLVDERHGGMGLGLFDLALTLEQAGRRILMAPLAEAAGAAWVLSKSGGDTATLAAVLDDSRLIVPATRPSSWAMGGGLSGGADAATLNGAVPFVPFAPSADAFLVATSTMVAVVDRSAAGVAVDTKTQVDGATASMVRFANAAPTQVLARGADAQRLTAGLQDFLALAAGAELLGLAAGAQEITLDYIKLRQQFGKPIGSFQILQHRAVDGFIDVELNRSLLYRVAAAFDAGEHHSAMASAAKARTSRAALTATRAALQMHGAIGYTDTHDIGLYYKRALALAARYGGELDHTARFSELTHA
jgi:alkylation response protein AidB-like acyl-CoA dehydrogenase